MGYHTATAESPIEEYPVTKIVIEDMIGYYSQQYSVSKKTMHKIISCESSYNTKAVNWQDSHRYSKGSHGIGQFSQQTFESYAKKMGKDYNDPYNPEHAIEVMAYMLSINQGNHWTCFRK